MMKKKGRTMNREEITMKTEGRMMKKEQYQKQWDSWWLECYFSG